MTEVVEQVEPIGTSIDTSSYKDLSMVESSESNSETEIPDSSSSKAGSETEEAPSSPSRKATPVTMKEDDIRALFLIMQQNLDETKLRSLYDLIQQNFPEEIEAANDLLFAGASITANERLYAEASFEKVEDSENCDPRDSIIEVKSSRSFTSMKSSRSQLSEKTTPTTLSGSSAPINMLANIGQTKGCYIHYEPESGKLKLQYSETPVQNAIGFYVSRAIPGHKFKKNFGRAELIGNCASGVQGRKNYYSGWCQFIRAARSDIKAEEKKFDETTGFLYLYPEQDELQTLEVDIYVYNVEAEYQTIQLAFGEPLQKEILQVDAVTCLPKHSSIFEEVRKMNLNNWLVHANNVGATTRFTFTSAPRYESPSPREPITLIDPSPIKSKSFDEDAVVPEPTHGPHSTDGCYLLYDSNSGKLKLQYSRTPVRKAIGFYCAGEGHEIRGFKYAKNFGRADLIGNCASGVSGRKNYYSGWCQFIRAAKLVNGSVWIYPRTENSTGLDVDIYVYHKEPETQQGSGGEQSRKLEEGVELNISEIDAVCCLPKYSDFFSEIKTMDLNWWMLDANTSGATSRFE